MPKIAVIMAVFDPNSAFLRRQIDSIFAQTLQPDAIHFIIADCQSDDLVRALCPGDHIEIHFHIPETPMTSIRAFEFGLEAALNGPCTHFALCDQDDVWFPEKLELTFQHLQNCKAKLVHSDARIVDENENTIHPSLFRFEKRLKKPKPRDLLYRNTVTGMTSLFTRDLAKTALPFPAQNGSHFHHDLWLGLLARAQNALVYFDRPLVSYRQHGANQVGASQPQSPLKLKTYVGQYGLARYLAEATYHRIANKSLTPFIHSKSYGWTHLYDAISFATKLRLALSIAAIFFAFITIGRKIWAVKHALITAYPSCRIEFDNSLFSLSPGVIPQNRKADAKPLKWTQFQDTRLHSKLHCTFDRSHARDVFLLPTLNPQECYAGVATAINIGIKRAERGNPVTFIATDMRISNHAQTLAFLESRAGPAFHDLSVEILCGAEGKTVSFHKQDRLFATAWWTAHMAHRIQKEGALQNKFYYIIQDYEPHFYPWGTEFAMARASYDLPHTPIFNSTCLRDYFAQTLQKHKLKSSLCFHPAVRLEDFQNTKIPAKRRLVLYGRPNVARNMFPMAVSALAEWIENRPEVADQLIFESIGEHHPPISLPNGAMIKSKGKLPWASYPKYLRNGDIGLALMCSPHPSHLPLEMAAAGMQVVTNSFASKDLNQLSPNIHGCSLEIGSISKALNMAFDSPALSRLDDLFPLGRNMDNMLDDLERAALGGIAA